MSSAICMPTVGEIARRLGRPLHRIEYCIRSRGIKAVGTAGNARVYSEQAVDLISQELERIDSARANQSRTPGYAAQGA